MDVVLAGQGRSLRDCRSLLTLAGFELSGELNIDSKCPVILGDLPHLFSQALQLIEAGRDILIASPQSLSAAQLASLLAGRKTRQAVFVWNERRYHPAYRLVSGLIRSDEAGWRPRYVRQSALSDERPSASLLRWRMNESLALAIELAGREPEVLTARGAANPWRGAMDFLSVAIELQGVNAFVEAGLGEGFSRRETVLAAHDRKAYIDELNPSVPVRLADDDDPAPGSRSVSCASPGPAELARLQCVAFLEAVASAWRCQAEADLWLRVIGCWEAIESSLAAPGLAVQVTEPAATGLKVLSGRGLQSASVTPPLRVVS